MNRYGTYSNKKIIPILENNLEHKNLHENIPISSQEQLCLKFSSKISIKKKDIFSLIFSLL